MAKSYSPLVSQLSDLKDLNKFLKLNCTEYYIDRENYILMRANNPNIIRIGKINHDDCDVSLYHCYLISAVNMTTFCTKYTKTNTEGKISNGKLVLEDSKKDINIELSTLNDQQLDNLMIEFYHNPELIEILSRLFKIILNEDYFMDQFTKFTNDEFNTIVNKEAIMINNEVYISRAILDLSKANSAYWMHLDIDDIWKDYMLFKVSYSSVDIYTLVAYVRPE